LELDTLRVTLLHMNMNSIAIRVSVRETSRSHGRKLICCSLITCLIKTTVREIFNLEFYLQRESTKMDLPLKHEHSLHYMKCL
jgi:hypothetical protein